MMLVILIQLSCRQTQAELDKCMSEKMNIKRPEVGYISRVRLFESTRPQPVEEKPKKINKLFEAPTSIAQVPEAVDSLQKSGQIRGDIPSTSK